MVLLHWCFPQDIWWFRSSSNWGNFWTGVSEFYLLLYLYYLHLFSLCVHVQGSYNDHIQTPLVFIWLFWWLSDCLHWFGCCVITDKITFKFTIVHFPHKILTCYFKRKNILCNGFKVTCIVNIKLVFYGLILLLFDNIN